MKSIYISSIYCNIHTAFLFDVETDISVGYSTFKK